MAEMAVILSYLKEIQPLQVLMKLKILSYQRTTS